MELPERRETGLVPDQRPPQPLSAVITEALQAAGRSEATRRSYQTAIGLFLTYLDQTIGDQLPADIQAVWRPFAESAYEGRRVVWTIRAPVAVLRLVNATSLDQFRAWRESQGDSMNSATQRVYAVRTWLAVALRDGLLSAEQAQSLGLRVYRQRQKRDQVPVGRRLTPAEVRQLRAAVDTATAIGARDLAILDTMLFLGLRREEVASLHLAHVRQDGGRWWVVFSGKGNKRRRIKIHDALFQSLSAWLRAAKLRWEDDGALFRSFDRGDHPTARPLDSSAIGRLAAHYGHAAGLATATGKNRLSAHDLRRTCARNAFDNGSSLLLVQAMLGHSDPKTTAYYIGAFEDDSQTAVDFVRY